MIAILGRKKGMSALYDERGRRTPATVIEAGPCHVTQVKTIESDGYEAVQIGFDPAKPQRVTKPMRGHFRKAGLKQPYRVVREFRGFEGSPEPGDQIRIDLIKPGDRVQITGTSKGKGFAGVIKRHNFSRPNQTHGTHEKFRGPGSIGAASYPARVWPGQKMSGHMGHETTTVKNLRVLKVDAEHNLIVVKGAVPGAAGGIVSIKRMDTASNAG